MCNALAMSEPPTLIGSREVCIRLGINRSTLSRWVKATPPRLTPVHRLENDHGNGAYLFDAADVEALEAAKAAA
jgi:hypothetical protein